MTEGEEDFTNEVGAADLGPPPTRAVGKTIHERRESVRGRLAGGLTLLFAAIVLGSGVAVWTGTDVDTVKSLLEVVLPPVVALTGSAVGFYFAGEQPPAP